MSNTQNSVTVKLLGKEYKISCPKGQESELLEAALNLDQKMSEIRKTGRTYGLERVAIIAALNLSHELLSQNNLRKADAIEINSKLQQLNDKIDDALVSGAICGTR